ncbi:MAG: hypothetical protein LBQ79_04310 [Deltaproteobacteria bacterium]|jgi:exopolyphosphatase/guanosine-5'-triphosphate,3'-diphosphate pyrophosphatase|nr:hypothetical protein [Deltaproteobacteria bacterium]
MAGKLYGALDLGSNTFRLILAEAGRDGRGPDPATRKVWQEIPRISEGLEEGKPFGKEPLARAWKALDGFAEKVSAGRPERVLAGCTMAARMASDGEEFAGRIAERYGWETAVLTGREEATLSAAGALGSLDPPPPRSVVFDIGGRSTEFVACTGAAPTAVASLPVGVVGLKELLIRNDPPAAAEMAELEDRVGNALSGAPAPPDGGGPVTLLGTAGTVTTMAAMLLGIDGYRPELVHGARISRSAVEGLYRETAGESAARRALRPGLHPMRADVIVCGLALVLGILDRYRSDGLVVSDCGLLEGLWKAASGMEIVGSRSGGP